MALALIAFRQTLMAEMERTRTGNPISSTNELITLNNLLISWPKSVNQLRLGSVPEILNAADEVLEKIEEAFKSLNAILASSGASPNSTLLTLVSSPTIIIPGTSYGLLTLLAPFFDGFQVPYIESDHIDAEQLESHALLADEREIDAALTLGDIPDVADEFHEHRVAITAATPHGAPSDVCVSLSNPGSARILSFNMNKKNRFRKIGISYASTNAIVFSDANVNNSIAKFTGVTRLQLLLRQEKFVLRTENGVVDLTASSTYATVGNTPTVSIYILSGGVLSPAPVVITLTAGITHLYVGECLDEEEFVLKFSAGLVGTIVNGAFSYQIVSATALAQEKQLENLPLESLTHSRLAALQADLQHRGDPYFAAITTTKLGVTSADVDMRYRNVANLFVDKIHYTQPSATIEQAFNLPDRKRALRLDFLNLVRKTNV